MSIVLQYFCYTLMPLFKFVSPKVKQIKETKTCRRFTTKLTCIFSHFFLTDTHLWSLGSYHNLVKPVKFWHEPYCVAQFLSAVGSAFVADMRKCYAVTWLINYKAAMRIGNGCSLGIDVNLYAGYLATCLHIKDYA